LAPSQPPRPMLGTAPARAASRRAFATKTSTLLLGAVLALSACGTQQSGAAAIVDDTVVTDKDVQTVALQLNANVPAQQKVTQNAILASLVLAPYVLAEGTRVGKTVGDGDVLKAIAGVPNPALPTVSYVRMQLVARQLDQASQAAIVGEISKSRITLNPRYGAFNIKQGFIRTTHNWLKASPSSSAQ
jgi:hypothetical protein